MQSGFLANPSMANVRASARLLPLCPHGVASERHRPRLRRLSVPIFRAVDQDKVGDFESFRHIRRRSLGQPIDEFLLVFVARPLNSLKYKHK